MFIILPMSRYVVCKENTCIVVRASDQCYFVTINVVRTLQPLCAFTEHTLLREQDKCYTATIHICCSFNMYGCRRIGCLQTHAFIWLYVSLSEFSIIHGIICRNTVTTWLLPKTHFALPSLSGEEWTLPENLAKRVGLVSYTLR